MENGKTINLNLEGVNSKELVVRLGDAPPINQPQTVALKGTITAPANYLAVRTEERQSDTNIVEFSYEEAFIKLHLNPTNKFAPHVRGELVANSVLAHLGINANGSTSSINELASTLKMCRHLFADRDQHIALLGNLSEDIIASTLPLVFKLTLPLFYGQPDSSIMVEVCLDVTNGRKSVWLESVELNELIINMRKQIIDEELKKFEGLVIIELA